MSGRFSLLVAVCLLAATTGCRGMWPRWFAPGDIQTQRYNATLHDPYPSVTEGPEMVGVRPRDYQHPLAEPRANQLQQDMIWQRYP